VLTIETVGVVLEGLGVQTLGLKTFKRSDQLGDLDVG
jgi:hypothetical protein